MNTLKNMLVTAVATLSVFVVGSSGAVEGNVDLPRYPSISPDGSEIVFSWRGDLWRVSAAGGHAVRLTVHPGDDLRSAWSSDGSRIAFESDRNGYTNLYTMNPDGTELAQVTDVDATLGLAGYGADSDGNDVLLFAAYMEDDVYRSPRPYMVPVAGGQIERVHDAFGSHPQTSPDGQRVAFTRGGSSWSRRHYRGPDNRDVWMYDRENDTFRQLTDWEGNDGKASWAANNSILFLSDREDDTVNLYRMARPSGRNPRIERLTHFSGRDVWDYTLSTDGSTAVLVVWDTLYTLDVTDADAEPVALSISASEDEADNFELLDVDRRVSEAALSPDGKTMAVVAYGEVYVRSTDDDAPTRRVTNSHAHERDIAWSPDGLKLYFVSDRDGTESIYAATVKITRDEVKAQFNDAMGIEQDEEPKTDEDPEAGEEPQAPAAEQPAGASDPISGTWYGTASIPEQGDIGFSMTLELAADGSVSGTVSAPGQDGSVSGTFDRATGSLVMQLATNAGGVVDLNLTVAGNSMSGSATTEGMVIEITAARGSEANDDDQEKPSNDADTEADTKKEEPELPKELNPDRWHDAWTFEVTPIVATEHHDRDPVPSPDGRYLTFRRSIGDVVLYELATGQERTLISGWDSRIDWRWSPDASRIAYSQYDRNFNADIWIISVDDDATPVNISQHPDNDLGPRWSADGKILTFVSERINEEYDVWSVYLDRSIHELAGKELEAYYEQAVAEAKKRKPLEVTMPRDDDEDEDEDEEEDGEGDDADAGDRDGDSADANMEDLDRAYLRLRRMTSDNGSEFNLEITPGGDRYIFTGNDGGAGLFSIDWKGGDRKRLSGSVTVQHLTLTGDKVVFVSGGRAGVVGTGGGSTTYYDISDEIRIDLQQQASQKFREAARILGEVFYHPTMKGLDWEQLTTAYHELARQSRTAGEFDYIAAYLQGELNGSHLGVRSPDRFSAQRESRGRLGITYDVVSHEGAVGFKVTSILPDAPADMGDMELKVGDIITAIDFAPLEEGDTLHARLKGRVGQETMFRIARSDADGVVAELPVILTPVSSGALRGLVYEAWQRDNQRKVHEWSDGRVGYLHIQGMNQRSLNEFERDLFAAAHGRDGLLIDVRNNGGGSTADLVLASIMVQPHAYTVPRGADPSFTEGYPQDRLFIQRYFKPVNMLCNEKSFSNAEIVSHAFKTLGRGTLVGQQTYGGVISTGGTSLIDGTSVRTPFRGWYLLDGTDMENNGAVPDILVDQTPEDEAAEFDRQLKAAVDDLLKRLDNEDDD